MLLMKLEAERNLFLQLAHYLARVDNNFGKEERKLS